MQRQTVHEHQGLAGTAPYGSVPGTVPSTINSVYMVAGIEPAPPSGVPYGGVIYKHGNCVALTKKGEACTAPKTKDSDFCAGHQRQHQKEKELNPEE